jgi:hypothetical protein
MVRKGVDVEVEGDWSGCASVMLKPLPLFRPWKSGGDDNIANAASRRDGEEYLRPVMLKVGKRCCKWYLVMKPHVDR